MNKWPEHSPVVSGDAGRGIVDENFETDLAAEERIQSGTALSHEGELSADRALRAALHQINAPRLPETLRDAVIAHSHGRERRWAWLATAAAVILSVIVVTALDPLGQQAPSPQITAKDWAQLTLAIETLNAQGQQIAQTTQAQVRPHLDLIEFELPRMQMRIDPLPYPDAFRQLFQPSVPQTRKRL